MDSTDIANVTKRIFFPARWPLIGHWFAYWIKYPEETVCGSLVLALATIFYGIVVSGVMGGEWMNFPFLIGTTAGFLLSFCLLVLGLTLIIFRAKELERKRHENRKTKVV